MKLYQQTPNCSDFDVIITKSEGPSFRVLLPEWIRGVGVQYQGLCHTIPGIWHETERGMHGVYEIAEQLRVGVEIETKHTEILVKLGVKNRGNSHIQDMWLNVCTSVNHLPGDPGWSNSNFLPSLPLDRTIQGRYWYEHVTPHHLLALTSTGWIPMHPYPDSPDANNVPLYSCEHYEILDA